MRYTVKTVMISAIVLDIIAIVLWPGTIDTKIHVAALLDSGIVVVILKGWI
jgi:energy-converting hydrogenase Eha subunit C